MGFGNVGNGKSLTSLKHLALNIRNVRSSSSQWLKHHCRHGMRIAGAGAALTGGLALTGSLTSQSSRLITAGSASGRGGGGYGDRDRLFTLTNGLIAMNALLYGAQVLTKDAVTVLGAKVNSAIIAGQWWRFITPAFLHGSVMHLVVNSYSLYNLAPLVESLSGGKRLFFIYMTAAVAGNVASFYGSALPSLGASGAVFGVGGALAVYFYRNRELYGRKSDYMLKSLWQTLLFNLLYGFANPRIDNWGHLGGMVGGAIAAWLLGPRLRVGRIQGHRGQYLVDDPPLPLLASPPRQIR